MEVKEMNQLVLFDLKNKRYVPDSMWEGGTELGRYLYSAYWKTKYGGNPIMK
ncbi:hypothetical protein [Lactococcus garvieae]